MSYIQSINGLSTTDRQTEDTTVITASQFTADKALLFAYTLSYPIITHWMFRKMPTYFLTRYTRSFKVCVCLSVCFTGSA
jgi:hypothetical protein